ncbi:MAG: lytic transglycosylase domain-containing protein [Lamprobacter sp.]|uniref:lytic transglycosylase domain-containing protein n=1 Tax=Lamprobacter sp. TaxID=3100796 RepID=UPI002B258EE2|nr:lytic transglycosylase domain-containing protein [Lamprobacter sp.]MEA3640057.1 lytic transglycosylase domain-containing protein [Lamprobacter sp.]
MVSEPKAAQSTSLPIPPSGPVPSRKALKALVEQTARRYGVEVALVDALVIAESGYDPRAVSPVGAVGLMQVMPATAADYGVNSVEALFDPQTNVRTGIRHLKRLLGQFGIGKAVMAYNAGEGALSRHNGFVTYPETQRYTHRVLSHYLSKKGIAPYSLEARELTGIRLTPSMAKASATVAGRGAVRQIDPSRLRLRIRPTLSERALDPGLHSSGPHSKPMFELQRPKPSLKPRN